MTHVPAVRLRLQVCFVRTCPRTLCALSFLSADFHRILNKKLGYRRDSARRRSLVTPFKVILGRCSASTSRKFACDFLLVNNTNLHPISHRFLVTAHCAQWSNYRLFQGGGCLSLMHSFSVTSANMASTLSHTLPGGLFDTG